MKKIGVFLILLFSLMGVASATGDTNIDGGGGDLGGGSTSGSGKCFWNPGNEGVRITVVDISSGYPAVASIDMANQKPSVDKHFGKVSKLYYTKINSTLKLNGAAYRSYQPPIQIPTIISSSSGGTADIEVVRNYFRREGALKMIANYIGMPYETLTNGKYKLVIEPIAYFTFYNVKYAMTATEAAIYDKMSGGKLRAKMVSLTHKNLPLSMFLQTPDLGYPAWNSSTNTKQDNDTIIGALGIGIVWFKTAPEPPPEVDSSDLEYRTDTDVITAIDVPAMGDITPDSNAKVTFTILGQAYTKGLVCPGGSSQKVWVRWRTPSTPQTVTIRISGAAYGSLTAKIVKLEEKEPPDPKYSSSNPTFRLSSQPLWGNSTRTTWYQWSATWIPGRGLSPGYWRFDRHDYSASLAVNYRIDPVDRVATAQRMAGGWDMKSGYGVKAACTVNVAGTGGVSSQDITPIQNVLAVFSEFGYENYDRFLEPDGGTVQYRATWQFKQNRYSYYKDRTHFTPLWYPDNTNYIVPCAVFDAWTPGGQLYVTAIDQLKINGSMYDDWYIRTTE